MGSKKGRKVRKIEVPTDSVPEFELGDTAVDIQRRREEREARERGRRGTKTEGGGGKEWSKYTHKRKDWQKKGKGQRKASCTIRLMNISRTKQGRSVSGRCLPTVTNCLSRCARPGLSRKGHIMAG